MDERAPPRIYHRHAPECPFPDEPVHDIREAEQTLRDQPHLTVGTLLDPVSGKFVSRRNRRALKP